MKKFLFFAVIILATGAKSYAQELGIYETENRFPTTNYAPTSWGANGFRTVDEQNYSMNEAVAAMQRERALENRTYQQAFIDNKKRDNKIIATKRSNNAARKEKNGTF